MPLLNAGHIVLNDETDQLLDMLVEVAIQLLQNVTSVIVLVRKINRCAATQLGGLQVALVVGIQRLIALC